MAAATGMGLAGLLVLHAKGLVCRPKSAWATRRSWYSWCLKFGVSNQKRKPRVPHVVVDNVCVCPEKEGTHLDEDENDIYIYICICIYIYIHIYYYFFF